MASVECLECGYRININLEALIEMDSCPRCLSRHVKVKSEQFSFIITECKKCHKCKDIKYFDTTSPFNEKIARDAAKRVWAEGNILCTCSNSAFWWILGIGATILIAGIGYFWWKKSKEKPDRERERMNKFLINVNSVQNFFWFLGNFSMIIWS